jgi:4-hydroxy 2-oxovalerate aldolase
MDRSAGDLARRTLDWPVRVEGFQRPGRRRCAADDVVRAPACFLESAVHAVTAVASTRFLFANPGGIELPQAAFIAGLTGNAPLSRGNTVSATEKKSKTTKPKESPAGRWLSYRPEIKVLDCTIRDGGLMNDHHFDDATVKAVYKACVEGGIDYMEIGYKASRKGIKVGEHGPWKYCLEEDIRRIVGDNQTDLKLAVMADAERCDYHEDIPAKKESVIDMIRVATYINQIPTALDMVKDAHDKGYETTVNLMAASTVPDRELNEGLEMLAGSEAQGIYVVDSFGALYSEQVQYLVKKYQHYCKASGKEVGVHMHNNLQLAYANTIEGIILGSNLLDATMAGLGRGAGNCPMELLIGFLHNPKYNLRPVLECVQYAIEPLRSKLGWGFDLPYMMTGLLNQHPRAAMNFKAGEGQGDIGAFYDAVMDGQ